MVPSGLGMNKENKHGGEVPFVSSSSVRSITCLPSEVLVEIIAKVACGSISDLCNVKLTCKAFQRAAEDDRVYHNPSVDHFPLVPLSWFTNENESYFVKRYRESGNPAIIYHNAMLQFFSYTNHNATLGLHNLTRAAMDDHNDAKYVYSMVLMNDDDEGERLQGFEVFCQLKASTCLPRCRQRVKCLVTSIWVYNPVVLRDEHSVCRFAASGTIGMGHAFFCEYYHADDELNLFFKMFEA